MDMICSDETPPPCPPLPSHKTSPDGPIIQELPPFKPDDNVTITCVALGQPKPTVHWIHNGEQVGEEERDVVELTLWKYTPPPLPSPIHTGLRLDQ